MADSVNFIPHSCDEQGCGHHRTIIINVCVIIVAAAAANGTYFYTVSSN